MLEENKTLELKDEELEKASGGGRGKIPSGGITYTQNYGDPKPGHYYSSGTTLGNCSYVYVTSFDGTTVNYNIENFWYDSTGWVSEGYGVGYKNISAFIYDYRYELNITY